MKPGENSLKPGKFRRKLREKIGRQRRIKEKPGTHGEIGEKLLGTSGNQWETRETREKHYKPAGNRGNQ